MTDTLSLNVRFTSSKLERSNAFILNARYAFAAANRRTGGQYAAVTPFSRNSDSVRTRPVAFYISLHEYRDSASYAGYESAIECFLISFHWTLVKIMPLESADDDHVMTVMSDALSVEFSPWDTHTDSHRLTKHWPATRAIRRALSKALSARSSRRVLRLATAREWESSGRSGGWSRGGTRWTEEG